MDLERLANNICSKTGATCKFTGEEHDPEYELTFELEEDRKQEITIYPFEEDNKGFVRMFTVIGKKAEFTEKKLISFLELNMSLRFGGFALFQGKLVLQTSAMYDSVVDEDRVINKLQYLVKMADQFEKTLIGLDRA